MPDNTPRLYEGLFLVSQSALAEGLDEATALIQGMLDRAESETLALRKWDDRKLAYPIAGQKRGTYIIAHFKVAPSQIVNIERDCNLSEDILRVLFTRCDHFGEVELKAVLEGLDITPIDPSADNADKPAEKTEDDAPVTADA